LRGLLFGDIRSRKVWLFRLDFIALGNTAVVVPSSVNQYRVVTIPMPDGSSLGQITCTNHLNPLERHDFLAQ